MNHKEHYELLQSYGVGTPSPEEVVKELVDRLIESLYMPDKELLFKADVNRLAVFGLDHEPINWGDLKVNEVYRYEDGYKVIIDEAAPGECPSLCAYIQNFMQAWGWIVYVETEW